MDKPTILVVDDVADNIHLLVGILKEQFKVKAATSGEKALKICQAPKKPDLIFLDIMMPVMDGYEVCQLLKSNDETKDIPVVFLSAKSEQKDHDYGRSLGAVDFLQKPVNPTELKACIDRYLSTL